MPLRTTSWVGVRVYARFRHGIGGAFAAEIGAQAQSLFVTVNAARVAEGKKEFHFEFLGRPGLLQDEIRSLVKEDEVAIVFVGEKMLDYRLDDVKKLRVPFVFVP